MPKAENSSFTLIEFENDRALVLAVKAAKGAGLKPVEAYTPYPIEELFHLLPIAGPRKIQVAAFAAGVAGIGIGYFMQYYGNAVSYALNVGGRAAHSVPPFLQITFELMVLTASLVTFFYLLRRMGLPKLHQPIFETEHFERASQDRFFLVLARDGSRIDPEIFKPFNPVRISEGAS